MNPHGVAAASVGLWVCNLCKLVSKSPLQGSIGHCPRCGARIHARKPHAIARTWALLITAAMLYIPANVLPVMETSSLFGFQKDTILSGVVYLWISGSQPLSLLVFIASITVPLLKLTSLAFLLASVQFRSAWRPDQRVRLYRTVEFIGRWSMLDIYHARHLRRGHSGCIGPLSGPGHHRSRPRSDRLRCRCCAHDVRRDVI